MAVIKAILFLGVLSIFSSCFFDKSEINVNLKNSMALKNVQVSSVKIENNQLIINGSNLENVSTLKITGNSTDESFAIESKTDAQIVANGQSNFNLDLGGIFNLVLSSAHAASTFQINFSLCDALLGGKGINCSAVPNDKEVLSYDASSGKWKPRAVNGLSYQGTYDASTGSAPSSATIGDYYIINVAGTIGGTTYNVGDWIVLSSVGDWERINNHNPVSTVFGRTGAITAVKGDYTLGKMGDVDLTSVPPLVNDVLVFNGTNWVPGVVTSGGTVTSVSGTAPIVVTSGTTTPVVSITQASSSANGYLSSTDWNTFNNKQSEVAPGTTTQYFRGDKSWQTLDTSAVSENTNLYFTNARALGVPLNGFNATNSAIVATDTILEAFNKTQGQINDLSSYATHFLVKDSADTLSSNVTLSGSINSTITGDITVRDAPLGLTSAVNKGYVDSGDALKVSKSGDTISGVLILDDDLKIKATGAGVNYVTLRANSAAANYNLVLPTTAGSTGQFLQTDGSGNLSWVAQSSTASPSGAAGGDLAGTYPNPSLKTGVVTDTHIATTLSQSKITNLTTDLAGKQSTTLSSGNILVGNGSNIATAVSVSGDATLNNTGVLTLSNSGVTAGTYNSVTVDGKGRVTGGTLGTTISSLGVTAPITNTGTVSDPVLAIDQANTTTSGYLSSTDWNTFNNKQATISKTTTQDVSKLRVYGANATNYVELSAATLTGNRVLIFPDSNGSSGNVLSTDGSGNLSWISLTTSAPVTSVNGSTGAVTLTSTNINEGTNLYHTDARVLGTPITAPTLSNSAIATSDTVQVAFGKLQAQFNNILSLALTGLSTATNAAITASDTIISAFGKLQKQITDLSGDVTTLSASNSNKLNKNTADSITATITVSGAGDILVPSTPAGMTSAVNKTYVDDRIANASNQWGSDGTNIYRTSGNVGIGTTNPSGTLEVNKNQNSTNDIRILNPNTGASSFSEVSIGEDIAAAKQAVFRYANSGVTANSAIAAVGGIPNSANLFTNSGVTGGLNLTSRANAPIRFFTNGIADTYERVRIDGTGNVGIGTMSPWTKLVTSGGPVIEGDSRYQISVADTSAQGPGIGGGISFYGKYTDGGSDANAAFIQASKTNGTSGDYGFDLILGTRPNGSSPAERMRITSTGNVGIGTTAPTALTNIYKNFGGSGTTSANKILRVEGQNVPDSNYTLAEFVHGGATPTMSIMANGNVGIGTTSPSNRLEVQASGTISASVANFLLPNMTAGNFAQIRIGQTLTSGNSGEFRYVYVGNNSSSNRFDFATYGVSTPTMSILNSGNVGIGTNSPQTKLDVAGSVRLGTDGTACSATIAGAMRFNSPNVEFCNGSAWTAVAAAGAAPVTSVNTLTGAVVLTTSEINEGANLYYTNARGVGSTISAPTLTNAAIAASDTIQIALGKLQAQFNNFLNVVLTGLSTATNSAITASDTILTGLGKLQAQINSLGSTKLDKTGGTLSIGTIDGVPNPTTANQVANKAYVDSINNSQTPSAYSPSCPSGYISVPAIPFYPGPSFCVMKYEAKGSLGTAAISISNGTPLVNINRSDARSSCRLIGPGYDLISNAQWQTIARNIADQSINWSSGTAYSGELNRGHSDNAPGNSLEASTDNDGCSGTGQACSDTVWDSQRRTHTLSNGEVIWDFSGNVWEWVTDNSVVSAGGNGYLSTMNANDRRQIAYGNDQFCASTGVTPFCGMGLGWFNYTAGAVLRGGSWNSDVNAGVFASRLDFAPTSTPSHIGFRCVFVP
ncbi:MAG: SUMF1/EgtB/PvdO family nonheme iron enzyme [Bacteriovoracaceae bacterium]|nr:SUMF1/EgtB/PvdO family nonheme iron enzyme [Bacteriovoracaceae bacterium]